jgi:Protein of unknown function (DUF4238)
MNSRVKKQHYISRTYLEGFSSPTKKKNLLWVRDIKGRWRDSRPENEGFEKDFQSLIDEEGNKSDILEEYFAPFEGEFKNIIRQIEKTRKFPQGPEQVGIFLSIMGLFAVRIPQVREQFKQFATDGMKKTMGLLLKDEKTYIAETAKARKDGYLNEEPVSYKEMLAFHQSGKYSIKHDPMWILETIFKTAATVTDLLHLRNWMVVEAPAPLFITSSKPANPFWTISCPVSLRGKIQFPDPVAFADHPTIAASYIPYNESTGLFPSFVPGFGNALSMVVFPITPLLALLGSWSPLPPYCKIDYCTVQAINWVTANSCADYVYSSKQLPILPWNLYFTPFIQDFHNHLATRLIGKKSMQ